MDRTDSTTPTGPPTDALAARIAAWTRDLAPRDSVEAFFVEHAARQSLEVEHASRVIAARDAHHARVAPPREACIAKAEMLDLGDGLTYPATDEAFERFRDWLGRGRGRPNPNPPPMPPELAIHLIESTADGCRWLAARWGELTGLIDERLAWSRSDQRRAIRLLGKVPDQEDDAVVRRLQGAVDAMNRGDGPHMALPRAKPGQPPPPTKAEAVAILRSIAGEAVGRLELLAARRDEESRPGEGEELRHAFDGGDEARALRRHRSAMHREVLKSLEMLTRLKKRPMADPAGAGPGAEDPTRTPPPAPPSPPRVRGEGRMPGPGSDRRHPTTALDPGTPGRGCPQGGCGVRDPLRSTPPAAPPPPPRVRGEGRPAEAGEGSKAQLPAHRDRVRALRWKTRLRPTRRPSNPLPDRGLDPIRDDPASSSPTTPRRPRRVRPARRSSAAGWRAECTPRAPETTATGWRAECTPQDPGTTPEGTRPPDG